MISVQEATSIILSHPFKPTAEEVHLDEALGKILAESIVADRDFPPFDRATMDGIAIKFESYKRGITEFFVESVQSAGQSQVNLSNPGHCIEIMTGAMLPVETDTVVPYENLVLKTGNATVQKSSVTKGQNIHLQGSDAKASQILVASGSPISPAEIALFASVGKPKVQVYQFPKTAIISTGNELVDIDQAPLPHQIRKSNSYALKAAVGELGGKAELFHLPDDEPVLKKELTTIIIDFDLVLVSGGVSKGKYDFVPKVLETLGVQKLFHQVSQKPGKPMWFGVSDSKFVFALPGNPVSMFMCFHRYVKPWLLKSLGTELENQQAILAEDFTFPAPLTYFLQVKIVNTEGQLLAYPITGGGSGDFVNLKEVDGFLELPKERNEFKKGEAFDLIRFRKS
jgi:molybdopterin molybdotransferase